VNRIFPIFLIAITSLMMYGATRSRGAAGPDFLFHCVRAMIEWIGAFALFLTINLFLGLAIILMIRTFTLHFMSVYDLENPVLIVFSAAQGFAFQRWWTPD
jgi:hypothetical protein